MSVLSCARNGCPHIMCRRLSHTYGYICDECFEELVGTGPTTDIEQFMRTLKKETRKEEADARYDAAFPYMDGER